MVSRNLRPQNRAQFGGMLAILISAALLVVVLVRDINVLSAWTILTGLAGGVLGLVGHSSRLRAGAAIVLLLAGAPAVFSYGLAYLVPIVLLLLPYSSRSTSASIS